MYPDFEQIQWELSFNVWTWHQTLDSSETRIIGYSLPINKPLLLHLVGCLYYLYLWRTVKQISDNEIYLLIKYIKSVLWRVAKCLTLYRGSAVPKG